MKNLTKTKQRKGVGFEVNAPKGNNNLLKQGWRNGIIKRKKEFSQSDKRTDEKERKEYKSKWNAGQI